MKVVITGGAGFIGSHLCQWFLAQKAEVVCIDNFITGCRANIAAFRRQGNFTLLEHDVTLDFDQAALSHLGDINLLVHLASPASPKDYIAMKLETALTNSIGTKKMLDLAVSCQCRFILASTSEIYGNPKVSPQPEEYWGYVNTLGPRSCYDEGKRFAEMLAMLYHCYFGLDVRIARIFNTYGPGMRPTDGRVIANFINQALAGEPLTIFGVGKQTRSFCYISDTVEGLYRLCVTPEIDGTVVNIGNPHEKTIQDLAELILRLCKSSSSCCFRNLPQDDPQQRRPDISKAFRVLAWHPRVPLQLGLKRTIAYFKKQNHPPVRRFLKPGVPIRFNRSVKPEEEKAAMLDASSQEIKKISIQNAIIRRRSPGCRIPD